MRRGNKSWHKPVRALTISACGIQWPGMEWPGSRPPNPSQVALCTEFLAKCTRTVHCSVGSYGLKHRVETCVGTYISNGALLRAARNLGISMVVCEGNPNAILGLDRSSIREAEMASEVAA